MYLIVVYDVEADRTDKPRKLLRKHLQHVQNSVFEGEVTEANAGKIKNALDKITKKDTESVIVYEMWGEKYVDREVFGEDPRRDERIL